ncbi:membrane protein of unknown function (plasmid) [Cupriavidus taiwanensis]|uniref:Amino acid permease n=1 Tax=Cupriavidus taiwanensis TaxID=164546 RepID=A0A375IW38_9BURK|nr:membrane protein of unknown function [Cupriavidus taiwanensis]
MMLYVDAFISPSGTGAIYTATTARMIHAMERNDTMPRLFGNTHPIYGVPREAMWFNLAVSFVFLFFFRGWGTLAAVISVAVVISFLSGPISLMALRNHACDIERPLHIRGMRLIASFAFVCATLVLYWARWPLTGQVVVLMVAALPLYLYYQAKAGWQGFSEELRSAWWLLLYLPGDCTGVLPWWTGVWRAGRYPTGMGHARCRRDSMGLLSMGRPERPTDPIPC